MTESPDYLDARPLPPIERGGEVVARRTRWVEQRVSSFARRALKLMTEVEFENKEAFETWWRDLPPAKESLWYWGVRLHRELAAQIAATPRPAWVSSTEYKQLQTLPPDERRTAEVAAVRAWLAAEQAGEKRRVLAWQAAIAPELSRLPAEVETMVRLFAVNCFSSVLGVDHMGPLAGPMPTRRVSVDRLLQILRGETGWPEVTRDRFGSVEYYLISHVAAVAESLLAAEDLPALHALRARHPQHRELYLAIAKFLPPAPKGSPVQPGTREHWLISGMQSPPADFLPGLCAAELVRLDLERHWEVILAACLHDLGPNRYREAICGAIEALAEPPRSPAQRRALAGLLLREDRASAWLKDDAFRRASLAAVIAYARRDVLTYDHEQRLRDPRTHDAAWAEVRRVIEGVLQGSK